METYKVVLLRFEQQTQYLLFNDKPHFMPSFWHMTSPVCKYPGSVIHLDVQDDGEWSAASMSKLDDAEDIRNADGVRTQLLGTCWGPPLQRTLIVSTTGVGKMSQKSEGRGLPEFLPDSDSCLILRAPCPPKSGDPPRGGGTTPSARTATDARRGRPQVRCPVAENAV